MTKEQLALCLDQLDPGGRFSVDRAILVEIFGEPEGGCGKVAEAFAEEHGCTFAEAEDGGAHFVKNDVY